MGLTFYLRNPQAKVTSITARFRWKKNRINYSTGIKISPKDWLHKKQRISSAQDVMNSTEKNTFLKNEKELSEGALLAYVQRYGSQPNLRQFKAYLEEYRVKSTEQPKEVYFYEFIEKLCEAHDQKNQGDRNVINKNKRSSELRQTTRILKKFEKQHGLKLGFERINLDFYNQFKEWCFDIQDFSPNTFGKHIKNVKALMNEALQEGLTNNVQHKSKYFKTIHRQSEAVYLDENELQILFELDLDHAPRLLKTRDLFLIGCYSGLRISDYQRLRKENIINGEYIKISTQKTGQLVEIPLTTQLLGILRRYDFKAPRLSEQKLNKYIKEVCRIAGITEKVKVTTQSKGRTVIRHVPKCDLVSSHTGRRSFATNMFAMDVPSLAIMSITGHKTEKAFLKYIKATPKDFRRIIQLKMDEKLNQASNE